MPFQNHSVLLGTVLASCAASAQTVAVNLTDLSLEQLSNIEVTSVSKRAQRLGDVAGSVYVIRRDHIRRSGATSLPEVLRLAPNLHVARADANQYAITARGFNSVLANKMLVLVDGRTVYSPLFSGVFWEAQDMMLEDIERIEVLSGSGGTLYGSNAVNGVINIITRSAADTQGTLVSGAGGNDDRGLALRHGRSTGSGAFRVFGFHSRRDHTALASGAPVRDAARTSHVGFRSDLAGSGSDLTLQGDAYETTIDQAPTERRLRGLNLLGRWSGALASGRAQLQGYIDHTERNQPGAVDDTLDTFDLEFQHLSQPRSGHQLLWGAGWRHQDDRLTNVNPAAIAFIPADRRLSLWNVFVQDEVEVTSALKATLGLKAEHNSYTGLEWLPNVRLAWSAAPGHLLWGAASRAVRTPSRIDREFFSPGSPPHFVTNGGENFVSEVADVYELGYRAQPAPALSYSATLFHHRFDRLRSLDRAPGGPTFNNNYEGRLTGIETWGSWRASDRVQLSAGYVFQRPRFEARAGTAPLVGPSSLGNDPRYHGHIGAAIDLGASVELDVRVRRVGALPMPAVPAYTAVDARLGWHVRPGLELSLAAANLADPGHPEWGNRTELARRWQVKAVWSL